MEERKKGRRHQKRIDPKGVDESFILSFKFTTFQKEVIKMIYEMRVLSTSQIVTIFSKNANYVRSQLLQLYKNAFLFRIFQPESIGNGSKEAYWMLDRGGAMFIAGAYGISMKKLNWDVRDNLIGFEKLAHAIQISEVRTRFECAAKEEGAHIETSFCDRHLYYEFMDGDKKMAVSPDLFITYNSGDKLYQFFFEIDRGTMAVTGPRSRRSVVISKVPKYEKFCASDEWKPYFEVYPRIIFLTTTKQRAKYMADAIKKSRETDLEFLVSTFEYFNEDPLGEIFIKVSDSTATNLFRE